MSGSSVRPERLIHDAVRRALARIPADTTIAVAFSGGIDSSVLLHAALMVAGAERVVALHVHHGLSPNADSWLAHCRKLARSYRVRFDAQRIELAAHPAGGFEAAAREARYEALDAMCGAAGARLLLLGHHADDQAETVLLQLLRGAGLPGLAGMPAQRAFGTASVARARPLLEILRATIEAYAVRHGVPWVDDESNQDLRYARNALRGDVLPHLAVHFPGYRDALARSARHAADAQLLLDEMAAADLALAALDPAAQKLSRQRVLDRSDARAANLLRYWMRGLGMPAASSAHLADLLEQLRVARAGAAIRIDHAGWRLRVYRDALSWELESMQEEVSIKPNVELRWRDETIWRLSAWSGTLVFVPSSSDDTGAVPAALLRQAPLGARSRVGGERLRTAPEARARSLKNLFQEAGVPPWQRDVPLIYLGETLLYVPLLGLNRGALPGAAPTGDAAGASWICLDWRPDLLLA